MKSTETFWVYFAAIVLLVGMLAACGDDECQIDSDCASGQVCATGSGVLFGGSSCVSASVSDQDATTSGDLGQDVSTEESDTNDDACVESTDEEFCQQMGIGCGALEEVDSCGVLREVFCGSCASPETCTESGRCECIPETNEEFCVRLAKDCDEITNLDNCGVERTVDCGSCPDDSCGQRAPNICGCPCEIDGQCYPAGAMNPTNSCEECDPDASASEWSNRSGSCDDGDLCTLDDVCEQGVCVGTPKTCSAPGQCQGSQCEPSNGLCQPVELVGTSCDDGDACTVSDSCVGGSCTGLERPCPDPGPCKTASCDPVTGDCVTSDVADGTPCDDGNACSSNETCSEGVCEAQVLVVCTPSGPCKTSECNPATGVCEESNRNSGVPCIDGRFCTVNTTCNGSGSCTGPQRICPSAPNCMPHCNEILDRCEQIPEDEQKLCPVQQL